MKKRPFNKEEQNKNKRFDAPKPRAFDKSEINVSDESIVSGRNAVRELLSGDRDIDKILVSSGNREGSIKMLVAEAIEKKIPVIEVDKAKLDSVSRGAHHQGIVAQVAEYKYSSVEDILDYAKEKGQAPFIVILDGVEDPHNLGAIIRSAECCGAHGVIIPKRRSVGLTPTVVKASAGAIEHMKVAKVTNIASTIDDLKEKGLWIYAADMGGEEFYKQDLSGSVAVVMGSEGNGISRLVKEKCDFTVSIKMYGSVNSMNVSCAASIIFAEIAKQKNRGV